MRINTTEARLCTIEQIEQFLTGSVQIELTKSGNDSERFEHISYVLKPLTIPSRVSERMVCY